MIWEKWFLLMVGFILLGLIFFAGINFQKMHDACIASGGEVVQGLKGPLCVKELK